jgi:hypothetical protein
MRVESVACTSKWLKKTSNAMRQTAAHTSKAEDGSGGLVVDLVLVLALALALALA